MAYQAHIHITGQTYHIFNRGVDHRPTFTDRAEFFRGIQTADYYRHVNTAIRLSRYLRLGEQEKRQCLRNANALQSVEILAFCLMPNHFHFLIKQKQEGGASLFLSQFQNSYTRYFNTKHDRTGALFLDRAKSVHIESETQLLHVSRYIHLNPYTARIVKGYEELIEYPYSSLGAYCGQKPVLAIETDPVAGLFSNLDQYRSFVLDRADYQRQLGAIKHLLHEDPVTGLAK